MGPNLGALAMLIGAFALPAWGYRLDSDLAKLGGAPLGLLVVLIFETAGHRLRRASQRLVVARSAGPMRAVPESRRPDTLLRSLSLAGTSLWALFAALGVLETPLWAGAAAGGAACLAFFMTGFLTPEETSPPSPE